MGAWPPPPPSTTELRESEALWGHGENVRCIAQCLEAECIPREVWNRMAGLNEAWDRLLGNREYGVQYDEEELTAAAIGFFVDRWIAADPSDPSDPSDLSGLSDLESVLLPVLNTPVRRWLWRRGAGACVYELVPVRPRPPGSPPSYDPRWWERLWERWLISLLMCGGKRCYAT